MYRPRWPMGNHIFESTMLGRKVTRLLRTHGRTDGAPHALHVWLQSSVYFGLHPLIIYRFLSLHVQFQNQASWQANTVFPISLPPTSHPTTLTLPRAPQQPPQLLGINFHITLTHHRPHTLLENSYICFNDLLNITSTHQVISRNQHQKSVQQCKSFHVDPSRFWTSAGSRGA